MKRLRSISLTLLALVSGITSDEADGVSNQQSTTTKNEFWKFASCDMKCVNDGYCSLIEGTADELAHMAQSGKLINRCVCKPGFTGVACENINQECILPDRKCSNGFPCRAVESDENGTMTWGCDCALADSLSSFAGKMCRDPLTEYCSGKFDPHAPLSFCTNGGRCRGDFINREVDQGTTTVDGFYHNAGCVCPRDFYGPHCEFLRLNVIDDLSDSIDFNSDPGKSSPSMSSDVWKRYSAPVLVALFGLLLSASLVITAVALKIRHQKSPPVKIVQFLRSQDTLSIMSMSTVNQGQYLGNIQFLDEGIIMPQDIDNVFENAEFT
jgi:hypothetical protein